MNLLRVYDLILFLLVFIVTTPSSFAAERLHPEKYYQERWCNEQGGLLEYVLDDKARVDCLTDEFAIEFDFANKWAESIGQALYYAKKTDRKPGIVLIMEKSSDKKYLNRLYGATGNNIPHIRIWTITHAPPLQK